MMTLEQEQAGWLGIELAKLVWVSRSNLYRDEDRSIVRGAMAVLTALDALDEELNLKKDAF